MVEAIMRRAVHHPILGVDLSRIALQARAAARCGVGALLNAGAAGPGPALTTKRPQQRLLHCAGVRGRDRFAIAAVRADLLRAERSERFEPSATGRSRDS